MAKNPMYHALRNKVEEGENPNTLLGFLASLLSLVILFAPVYGVMGFVLEVKNAIWWLLGYFGVGQFVLPFTSFRFSARKDRFDLIGHLRQNFFALLWPYFLVRPEKDD